MSRASRSPKRSRPPSAHENSVVISPCTKTTMRRVAAGKAEAMASGSSATGSPATRTAVGGATRRCSHDPGAGAKAPVDAAGDALVHRAHQHRARPDHPEHTPAHGAL